MNAGKAFFFTLLVCAVLTVPGSVCAEEEDGSTNECSVCVVGDLMCLDAQMKAAETGEGSFDFGPPFALVRDELGSADLTIGNLETVFAPERLYSGTLTGFNAPADYLKAISDCGFDVLATANNHCMDMGTEGVFSTARLIRESGICQVGTNLPGEDPDRFLICDVTGVRIAVLNYTMLVNRIAEARYDPDARMSVQFLDARKGFEKERLSGAVTAARDAGADVVIVYLHCGIEYRISPVKSQTDMAATAFEAGADIVLESHSHTLQRMEQEMLLTDGTARQKFCAYGLGNFMSSFRMNDSRDGVILRLDISVDKAGGTVSTKASYIATFTEQWEENGRRFCRILPIRNVLEGELSGIPVRESRDFLRRELNRIEERIGKDAESVLSFSDSGAGLS